MPSVCVLLLMSCNQRQQKRPQGSKSQQYIYNKLNSTITTDTAHISTHAGESPPAVNHTRTHTHSGEEKAEESRRSSAVSCRHCDFYCRRQLPLLLLFPLQLSAGATNMGIPMPKHTNRAHLYRRGHKDKTRTVIANYKISN